MSLHFHPLQVREVRRETAECVSVSFEIPPALKSVFAYQQGQNITVKATINGKELRRNYSICSSPLEDDFRIAIKQLEGGQFSTYANRALQAGDTLELLPPTGKFFTPLDPAKRRTYVAFAAGSGITPILSILRTTLETEPQSQFLLVYGNRSRANILFREALEALKNKYPERFQLIHVLSRERTEAPLTAGRIDAEKCRLIHEKILSIAQVDAFFLCGPSAMIETVRTTLETLGADRTKIHYELFHAPGKGARVQPSAANDGSGGQKAKVTVQLDGIITHFELDFHGDTILEAAMKQGIDVPFACKGGMCCTCRARLESGEVDMDVNYALEEEEVANGFILTCQSHPRTDIVSVNYDVR